MLLLLQNALPPMLYVSLGVFGPIEVLECRVDMAHVFIIQGPVYGDPG
jgi:Na+-transporting NADH:ubiquinone oxidoreductase subunit NqrE